MAGLARGPQFQLDLRAKSAPIELHLSLIPRPQDSPRTPGYPISTPHRLQPEKVLKSQTFLVLRCSMTVTFVYVEVQFKGSSVGSVCQPVAGLAPQARFPDANPDRTLHPVKTIASAAGNRVEC